MTDSTTVRHMVDTVGVHIDSEPDVISRSAEDPATASHTGDCAHDYRTDPGPSPPSRPGARLSRLHDTDRTVSSADEDIRGRMVKDTDGTDIGKIEHLLIDDVEQRVRFMEVASGGFLHVGERKSFIPVEAITRITDDAVYIGHTAEHVAGAPAYNPDLVTPDLIATSADYFSNLYPYYGYQGYYSFVGPLVGYPYARRETTPTPGSSD